MAVIKLSKDQIKTNNDEDKIKLKKNQISVDSERLSTWETTQKNSYDTLNSYMDKVRNREYLSADDLASYKDAMTQYIDSSNNMRGINSFFGGSNDDEKEWNEYTSSLQSMFDEVSKYWSQWENEDAYNAYLAYQKDYEEKLNFNLDAGQRDIDYYRNELNAIASVENQISAIEQENQTLMLAKAKGDRNSIEKLKENEKRLSILNETLKSAYEKYGSREDLESYISEKNAYLTLAQRAQKAVELASVADVESENYDPEFNSYAQQGKALDDGSKWTVVLGGKTQEPNPIEYYRRSYSDSPAVEDDYGVGKIGDEAAFALAMTEEEVKIYDYYLAKDGKEKAQEYLDSIEESVNSRVASGYFKQVEDKPVLEYLFGVTAGLDQFASGIENLFSDKDYIPTTSIQMASGMVREDLEETGAKLPDWLGGASLGQVGYDVINTTSNMLPSILAATAVNAVAPVAGAAVGAGLLGASAGGNAKAEMLNLGYSKEQANAYGVMVAIAEGGMEYFLGGITKLGGKLPNGITGAILNKVDNAFARAAIKIGGSMVSEGLEEGLQAVIEPWLKEIATGVDWEDPNIDEVLYSSLLGALSAFGLEGAGVVAGEVGTYKSGKTFQQVEGGVAKLQELGSTFSADTVAYKLASKVNAQTNAYTIGRLLNEVGGTISEQNLTDIVNGLTQRGMDTKTATKLAKQYQAFLNNEMRMTDEQVKILENLSPLADVLRTNIIGQNTTVYQRTRGYANLMKLADEVSNGKKNQASDTVAAETSLNTAKATPNIFEQKKIVADMNKLASDVSVGSRMSASERFVRDKQSAAKNIAEEKLGVEGRYTSKETGSTRLSSNKSKVSIVGIESKEDGDMMVKLDNGTVVSADDIDFGTSEEALVYEAVANMDISANTAWEIIKGFDSKSGQSGSIYAMGALEAYTYGHNGVKVDGMSKDGFSAYLSSVQKNTANRLGDIDARAKVEARQKTIDKAVKTARDEAKSKGKAIPRKKGEIVFEGDRARLTDLQEKQFGVLEKVSDGLGVTFHVFESKVDAEGKRYYTMPNGTITSANGWYDTKTGEIWIDLYAGNDGQGTMIFTAAHELTHFIRQWSPAKFKAFADFLFEQYGKNGQDVNRLIRDQIQKAANNGRSIGWDEAYEEVVADSAETFLRDSKAAEKVAALREKDAGLANKIKSFLGQMLAKMRKVMADLGLAPETEEGKMVAEMTDVLQKLYGLWTDALTDAGTAYSTIDKNLMESGIFVDSSTESASLMSVRYLLGGNQQRKVAEALATRFGVTVEEAKGWIDAETSLASIILNPKYSQYLDYTADDSEDAIKSNSDYPQGTVDFSNICKKRRDFTEVMNRVLRNFPTHVFEATDLAKIRTIMSEEGMEVACGICYVEDRRQLDSIVAQDFIDSLALYRNGSKTRPDGKPFNANQLKAFKLIEGDSYTPSIYELISLEGRNSLKAKNPAMEEAWVKFNNARGMQSVRLLLNDAEYKRQILKYSPSVVKRKNDLGGLRIYSFSDMEMFHLIDIIQVITDSATVGLSIQGYTKVNEYAKAVKDTGEKLNRSLIPKGDLGYHMEDGKVVLDFDTVEGIDINHPDFFDSIDNPNIGNIVIGINPTQIRAAMTSKFIDQIIPFHTGQSGEVLGEKGIATWVNYKDFQSERDLDTQKKSSHQINIYTEVIDAAAKEGHPITNKVEFVNKFLEVCKENKLIPRFSDFLNVGENGDYVYTEGYHKFLVDFKTFDQNTGKYLPQMPVKPIFDNEYIAQLLKDYVETQKEKDAKFAENMPKVLDRITNEIVNPDGVRFCERDNGRNEFNPNGETLKEQLKDALETSQSFERRYVYVGMFTQSFIDKLKKHIDIKKYPIVMNYRDAYLSMEAKERGKYHGEKISYHNLGVDGLEAALLSFDDPEYVLLSPTKGKIELVLQGRDYKNRQLFAIVEVNTKTQNNRKFMDVHVVTSVYGNRGLKNRIIAAGQENRVIYKKEEESTQGMPQVQYKRDINANSSANMIAQESDSVNRETKKNSLRNVEPIESADYVKMYHHFGSTKNYDVAGYILGNGVMLDFSGKHWGDDFSTSRQVDHRDVQEVLGNRGSNNGVNAMIDMIGNGNIRLMPEVGGINLAVKPNASQMSQLRGYINHFKGEVVVDVDEVGGDTIHSFTYTRGTSSTKILADIKAYFDEGVVPEQKAKDETDIHQFLYSNRVTDKKTIDFLENQEHVTVYRAMQVIDGNLYPPMNAYTYDSSGKKVLMPHSEIGAWEQSVERPDLIDPKTGKFKLDKGKVDGGKKGTLVPAAYNPYIHTSLSMLNDQFTSAYTRSNLVVVKGVVPKSELTSGYHAQYAKDSVGETEWHSGVVSSHLPTTRKVILSRWFKPIEIVGDDVVAENIKKMLSGTDIEIPYNVVSPNLRRSLENIGVPIGEGRGIRGLPKKDDVKYSDRSPASVSKRTILANALEGAAQNDIEKNKLALYKSKIALIESEQAKLAEVRAKANELRFTKGRTPDETKRMKALDFEANQIANRVNTYDRQLLNLESTAALKNVLQREKEMVRKKTEQKGKEALAAYKEKSAQTQRELMNRYQESRKKNIESRSMTAIRHKIKDIVSDLNALLLNPTKDKHVPIGLQKPVAAALDIINMDTVGADERVAKYNALIAKANDPDVIASLKQSRDRIALQGETLSDKLTALKAAYAEIKNSDDPLVKNSHDEAIANLIDNTIDKVGNTALRDMSLEQLEAVYDMFKAIKATVRNANKMFKEGRQETVTENSEAVKTEVRTAGGHRDRVLKATKWLKKVGWDMLKPLQAMRVIGSDTFAKLFENVRKGEDTWAVDVSEAKDFFKEKSQQYGYDSWDFKKQYTFKDSVGNTFSLSLEQIMSLYAYSKREQADRHLEVGGFIFDDAIEVTEKGKLGIPMKYEVNDANPYRLRREDLGAVIGSLTSEQRGFIDEMQAYLSDVMGEKGNEVSLAMYDIKLYNEKHYFPLKTARYFREFDPEKNATPKIKNSGFSKKTVPQAGNPIVLSNFMDVWANHVNDMSMYHAFVLPLEDFMRVYNYSSTAGGYDSVQQYIKNAYGSQANQYIERLMEDLNGGARVDSSAGVINKGIGLFKKASVFASASVVVQQPSAIARALAYVDAKYFVDKPEATKHKETWAEVKRYAPVAIIKEMGYFDTNMGRSTVDWIRDEKTLMNKIDDVASKAPALADELAWCAIWKAVKREVAATTNLKVGSEEFLKRAGERFTEVVANTQVYDSVLSRSGMMRSKDTGMKMATAFMAEPTTSLNMVVDAIIQGKRGNKKFATKTVGAVAASVILNSILVSLVYAARDDDDNETYAEKYLASLTSELIDGFNPLTYIPFVKDIWSIAQGYDVERSDMSVVSKLWESIENLFNDNKSGFEKVEGVVGSIASFFGLPLKNLMRDARAMYNLTTTLLSGTPTTKAGVAEAVGEAAKSSVPLWSRIEKWAGAADSKHDKLYDAIMSGDEAHIERMKSGYDDGKKKPKEVESAINAAIRKALRENDPRIKEAAQAAVDGKGSTRASITKEILAEGNFDYKTIAAAVNAEIDAIRKKDKEKK